MKIRKQSIQQAQQAARDHLIKSITIKCCFYAMLLVLNGLEGYGKKRLQRVFDEFAKTLNDYQERYDEAMADALEQHVVQRGIEVKWK